MEWTQEKSIEVEEKFEDGITLSSNVVTYSIDQTEGDSSEEENLTTTIEKQKEFEDLIKTLETENCVNVLEVIKSGRDNYVSLEMSREKEESLEPKKIKLGYMGLINHYEQWPKEYLADLYIDRPALISRIDSPFKPINENNIRKLVETTGMYPEKFGMRSRIDLKRLRSFLGEKKIIEQGNQDKMLEFYRILKDYSIPSIRMETLFRFGEKVLEFEEHKNRINLLKCNKKKKPIKGTELSTETLQSMWMLNLFEVVNHKIKLSYSSLSNKRVYKSKDLWHEGRKIKCMINSDGSSVTSIKIRKNNDDLNDIFKFKLFISHTFHCLNYGPFYYIGDNTLIKYLFTVIENECTINIVRDMNFDRKCEAKTEENKFIDYVKSLSLVDNPKRTELAASYETLCLMMADTKVQSSSLPVMDAIIESLKIDREMTEKLVNICRESDGETCIKMSGLGKINTFAEVDTNGGLEKYVQRTNRKHSVSEEAVENLRWLFRMKVVTNYVKKYGIVPPLRGASGTLEQELNLMASGGSYNSDIVSNQVNYKNIRLGQMLQPGQEVNVASRVIDKACTKDEYDFSGNSVKELIYYITKNDIPDLIDSLSINKFKKEFERECGVFDRKDEENIGSIEKYKMVRLVEKEKELKTKARFYGVASFKLKIYISVLMEMIKRAMKLIPGQMMTMTEDERRQLMHQMSKLLDEDDSYSLFLDYSGHNTSQRPENNLFIMEEISDMYGFEEGSKERERMTMIVYLFSDIVILYEELFSDNVMISRYQKGAIEGWFGPLWGIQSQLMMEDMMRSLNFSKFIGTTYSDDSCGVFVKKELDEKSLNNIIKFVQAYALKMGLLVKLSQTQVTNGRCSMLKNHYFKDRPIDMSYKRVLAISPNSEVLWGDDLERMMTIDSGFTSSTLRTDNLRKQIVIRNYRAMTVIEKEVLRWSQFLDVDLNTSFISNISAMRKYAELCLGKIKQNKEQQGKAEELRDQLDSNRNSLESDMLTSFYHFNMENDELIEATIMMMYLPYTMYGYAMTSLPDAMISGFSHSNVKRIEYVNSLLSHKFNKKTFSLINFSSKATCYITEPFPLEGGRHDTKSLLKDELKKILSKKVTNKQLKELLELGTKEDERTFKHELLSTFQFCFSHRIVSKFLECSIFAYVEDIYSKIDNSTTLSFFLGKRKMNKLWNKAWNANHMINYKSNDIRGCNFGFNWIVDQRDTAEKKILNDNGEWEAIEMEFLKIEELPIIGTLEINDRLGLINPIRKAGVVRTGKNRDKFRLAGPAKTHMNLTKFDRDIEIEGMFSNKLIFLIYELVRYVKWMIMDMEKFGKVSDHVKESLMKITEVTINTYSDCKISDVIESVVCPKGGRYFHRALSGGFNPKTGDLTSNIKTNRYEITGLNNLLEYTGGVDNNINLSLVVVYIKVMMGYFDATDNEMGPLMLYDDIVRHAKDVTFNLEEIKIKDEINPIQLKGKIPTELSTERIKQKGRLYKNYSYFISCDQEIKGKFVDHKSVMPNEKIDEISSFRSLHKYMEDQEIISPEMIPDDVLLKIAPEVKMSINRDNYLNKFYKFYKGLNIIGNESYTKTVMRSIINSELIGNKEDNDHWIKEIEEYGYSVNYRKTLMKIFIISTCLVFRLEEINPRCMKMIIKRDNTKQNGVNNLTRLKKNQAHFHIRDKRVSDLIMMAFPTSGYRMSELFDCIDEIYKRFNNRVFETEMLVQYYDKDIKHYITNEFDNKDFGAVRYEEIDIDDKMFKDSKMTSAAIKSYEMICTLHCKPQHVSSPTMSDVYPSAMGLLTFLKEKISKLKIMDVFGGRGDFHFAMTQLSLCHTSISRNDGYNLINRVPGMIEIKGGVDMTLNENYGQYLDHDVFLMDLSHFTGSQTTLRNMIEELFDNDKMIVIRINSIINQDLSFLQNLCNSGTGKLLLPSVESPGYMYVMIEKSDGRKKPRKNKNEKIREEKTSFTESIIAEKLTNEIYKMRKDSLFNKSSTDVMDHTMEIISDETLLNILLEDNNDDKFLEAEMEKKLMKGNKIKELIITEVEEFYIDKKRSVNGNGATEQRELKEKHLELMELSWPVFIIKDEKNIPNKSIFKKIKEEFYKNNNKSPEIEVNSSFQYTSGLYMVGLKDGRVTDLIYIIEHLLDQRIIRRDSYQSLKTILLGLKRQEGENSDLEGLFSSIETGVSFRDKYHSFDRMIKIAKIVKRSYLSRNVEGVFLQFAGIRKGSMKSLMENKTRSHRYDCLNFKLLLNRMIGLHERLFLELIAKPLDVKELLSELGSLKLNKKSKNRSIETLRLSRNKEKRIESDEIERRIENEIKALREFDTLEEYLSDRFGNELFNAITEELTERRIHQEPENQESHDDSEVLGIEEMEKAEIIGKIDNEIALLLGATKSEIERNENMTTDEMRKELGEDCWEDFE
nr:TPA_asm: polymerase [Osteospermum ophiovirus]